MNWCRVPVSGSNRAGNSLIEDERETGMKPSPWRVIELTLHTVVTAVMLFPNIRRAGVAALPIAIVERPVGAGYAVVGIVASVGGR